MSSSPSSRLTRAALSPVNLEVGGSKVDFFFFFLSNPERRLASLTKGTSPAGCSELWGGMEPRRSP